jgi:hypothetical protein
MNAFTHPTGVPQGVAVVVDSFWTKFNGAKYKVLIATDVSGYWPSLDVVSFQLAGYGGSAVPFASVMTRGSVGPQLQRLGEAVQRPRGLGFELEDEVVETEPLVGVDRPGELVN